MIEGHGVTKTFRDFWRRPRVTAVRDVDIDVRAGSVFGLLGPNGAGKSTLIRMILGHLYPTAGSLKVLGRSPRNVEAKSRLGYLPERTSFYPQLTAREVLRLFGDIIGLSKEETAGRSEQLLEMVGLQGAGNRRIGGFSHGMGRRLGLAQALLNDPDLLLLDEPTAGLDPIGCHEVKTLIATLARRGKTVLVSSHLLADVQDVCDIVMILYGGKVQQTGPVDQLLASKNEIEIRLPSVSQAALGKATAMLARETDKEAIRVSVPTRSLESYFLDVVREANEHQQDTAGARIGSGVAEYLQIDTESRELLDSLTHTEDQPAPGRDRDEVAGESSEPVENLDRQVLSKLAQPEEDKTEEDSECDDIDQDVLDSLL